MEENKLNKKLVVVIIFLLLILMLVLIGRFHNKVDNFDSWNINKKVNEPKILIRNATSILYRKRQYC